MSSAFLLNCDNAPIIGVDKPYEAINESYYESLLAMPNYSPHLGLDHSCNADCGCSTLAYRPVCADKQYQFFSPCYAGCTSIGDENYGNCTCLANSTSSGPLEAIEGMCPGECPALYSFLALFFLVVFFTFFVQVPLNTITLRSTSDSERPFAIGLQWILIRFMGTVPGPIVFGSVIDSSCIVWQGQCAGDSSAQNGACWLYNTRTTSVYLMGVGMVIHFISLLANVAALAIYRPPPGVDLTDPLTRAVGRLCFCRRNRSCLANTADSTVDKEETMAPGIDEDHGAELSIGNGSHLNAAVVDGNVDDSAPVTTPTRSTSSSLNRAFQRNKPGDTIALVSHEDGEALEQAPPTPIPSPGVEHRRITPAIRPLKPRKP